MKVIDILNKIANGEEDLPDIIIVGVVEDKHYYNKDLKEYINQRTGEKLFEDGYGKFLKYYLNDEVEIIEENKPKTLNDIRESYGLPRIEDKKIENIDFDWLQSFEDNDKQYTSMQVLFEKIDEIIDYLNKEKE